MIEKMFKCNWKLPVNTIEQAGGVCIHTKYTFFFLWLIIHSSPANKWTCKEYTWLLQFSKLWCFRISTSNLITTRNGKITGFSVCCQFQLRGKKIILHQINKNVKNKTWRCVLKIFLYYKIMSNFSEIFHLEKKTVKIKQVFGNIFFLFQPESSDFTSKILMHYTNTRTFLKIF